METKFLGSLREDVEHICVVDFINGRLYLPTFEIRVTGLLGLWILDTKVSHGGYVMLWTLDFANKYWRIQMVVCTWESSLLGLEIFCLMPRMKFSFDTILNIIIDV